MGWEERGGRRYYYRKRREGRRVVSEYVGGGPLAEEIAEMLEGEREYEEVVRRRRQRERAALEAEAAEVRAVGELVRTITHAALLAGGYHTHKGQWRKRRESEGKQGLRQR